MRSKPIGVSLVSEGPVSAMLIISPLAATPLWHGGGVIWLALRIRPVACLQSGERCHILSIPIIEEEGISVSLSS